MNRIFAFDLKTLKRVFQLVGLLTAFACSSFGSSITYTYNIFDSGTIGFTSFGDVAITIPGVGNTSNIQPGFGGFYVDLNSASITIAGVGTFEFTTPTAFFAGGKTVAFCSSPGCTDLVLGPKSPAFSSWALNTSIGPITGQGQVLQWTLTSVLTSGGAVVLGDLSAADTFSARSSVPEPGALLLLATGLLGIGRFVKGKITS